MFRPNGNMSRLALAALGSTCLLLVIFTYRDKATASFPAHPLLDRPRPHNLHTPEFFTQHSNDTQDSPWQVPLNPHKSGVWLRQCGDLPGDVLYDIAIDAGLNRNDGAPVFAHFQNSAIVPAAAAKKYNVQDEFCTVILVPQPGRNESAEVQSPEIPYWGPDGMHASIRSDDVWLIFDHPIYWGSIALQPQHETDKANDNQKVQADHQKPTHPVAAVYATAYTLNHPGSYQVQGAVEFQNYDWAMQDDIELYTVDQKVFLPYYIQNITITPFSAPITIEGAPVSRPTTQCYHDNHNDLHGRWYLASSFSARTGNQTRHNPAATLEYASHPDLIDEWGYTFAPDACDLPVFTPTDHAACLGSRTLAIHGDSNSRRFLKSLIASGTSTWCPDPNDRTCQCQDTWEKTVHDGAAHAFNNTRYFVDSQLDEPITFGPDNASTTAYFDMLGGLVRPNHGHEWEAMFARSMFAADSPTDRRLARHGGKVDVVHSSFIGWDVGYASAPEWADPQRGLPALRKALHDAYPAGTRLIQRMANAPCCGNYNRRLRYNTPRYALWNAAWRDFFKAEEEGGEMRVVDVAVLQGRPDAEMRDGGCPMTHLRASHTRLEGMMWMSAVCDKDGGRGARMSEGWGLKGPPVAAVSGS